MWETFRDLFFGTPRRAMITLGVVLVLVAFGAIEALIAAVTGLLSHSSYWWSCSGFSRPLCSAGTEAMDGKYLLKNQAEANWTSAYSGLRAAFSYF